MPRKKKLEEILEDLQVTAYEKGLSDKSAEFVDSCDRQLKVLHDQRGSRMALALATRLKRRAERYYDKLLTFPAYRIRQFKEEAKALSQDIQSRYEGELLDADEEE